MNDAQSQKVTGKTVALLIIAAIVTAVLVTIIQQLVLGRSIVAVTGGIVGATVAAMAVTTLKKK
jgi:hypothetical protein